MVFRWWARLVCIFQKKTKVSQFCKTESFSKMLKKGQKKQQI